MYHEYVNQMCDNMSPKCNTNGGEHTTQPPYIWGFFVGTPRALYMGMMQRSQRTGHGATVGGNLARIMGCHMATKRTNKPDTTSRETVTRDDSTEPAIPENKNVGRYFGHRVVAGQNAIFESNREWHLTDDQIATLWRNEWPNAACDYSAFHVRGARRDYNRGKHGNPTRPRVPVPAYRVTSDGATVAVDGAGELTVVRNPDGSTVA